jgi:hypothetical protein
LLASLSCFLSDEWYQRLSLSEWTRPNGIALWDRQVGRRVETGDSVGKVIRRWRAAGGKKLKALFLKELLDLVNDGDIIGI